MKELITEPPVLIAIIIISLLYFLIIFELSKNTQVASFIGKISIYIFLFTISGTTLFPFTHLHPAEIGDPEKSLSSAAAMLIIYASICIILRGSISQILSNFIILFFKQHFLGIYIAILALSAFWSAAPLVTLKAALGLIFLSVFAVYLNQQYNWQELVQLLRWNHTIIAIVSIFAALFIPSIGLHSKGWSGIFGHPIDLGTAVVLTPIFWWLNIFSKSRYFWRSIFFSALGIIVIFCTNSTGALAAFLIITITLLIISCLRRLKFLYAVTIFSSTLLFLASLGLWLIKDFEQILAFFEQVLNHFGKSITLSGRIPLWTTLIDISIKQRPWLGYGYNAFWQRWRGYDNDSPATQVINIVVGEGRDWVSHAHNGFLDIVLSVGLIGLMIFIFSFLINIIRAIKLCFSNKLSESIVPLLVLIFVFAINFYNHYIGYPGYAWFLYVLMTVRLEIETRKKSVLSNHKK